MFRQYDQVDKKVEIVLLLVKKKMLFVNLYTLEASKSVLQQ